MDPTVRLKVEAHKFQVGRIFLRHVYMNVLKMSHVDCIGMLQKTNQRSCVLHTVSQGRPKGNSHVLNTVWLTVEGQYNTINTQFAVVALGAQKSGQP